ncbi:alkaline phosphatase family protein [Flavobacterium sp. WC2509]|uniref:alkaline phosphatase family protein n=1 Tax=Flavobacterium sp. WC2509 TaxID=3461406 RepID=UPI0040439FDC
MKFRKYFVVFLMLFCALAFAQKSKKVVFVIADGIPLDIIQSHSMLNLNNFSKNGGIVSAYVGGEKNGYSETPTISAVGYNSLLTGTWVNKHNVWGNDIKEPNYNYWNIFRYLKTQYPEKKTAIFSTWKDNRTKLIGSDAKAAGNLNPDFVFDGYEKDIIKFPHDKNGDFYNKIDNYVVENACKTIAASAPDLSWIYLEYTDEMGHRHGDSPEFLNALDQLDSQIGKLYKTIQKREKENNEEWMVIITTDHGRDTFGFKHGGQTNRERNTWMATNYAGINDYYKKQQPGIVDITPTILRFLNISPSQNQQFELDGVPMIGELSAINLSLKIKENKLIIQWTPLAKIGKAKIWLSTTNNFKTGGTDEYQLIKEMDIKDWKTEIDISSMTSKFYKVVIEMPNNTLNRWITIP